MGNHGGSGEIDSDRTIVRPAHRAAAAITLLASFVSVQGWGAGSAVAAVPGEAPEGAALPFGPDDLIVGTDKALEIWGLDGRRKKVLSTGEAHHPRWLDPQTIVVLRTGGKPLHEGAVIETIDARDGRRHKAGRIPAFNCGGNMPEGTSSDAVDLQEESDFAVDQEHRWVCIDLMDRNVNMASLSVGITFALDTGKSRRWVDLGQESCSPPAGVKKGARPDQASCKGGTGPFQREAPHAEAPKLTFPFSIRSQETSLEIVGDPQGAIHLKDYAETPYVSPSQRWVLLQGEQEDGDYIHFKLVLFDRQTGQVFPPGGGNKWPAPLKVSGKGAHRKIKVPIAEAADAVGETTIQWFGDPEKERLLLDKSIIVPGQRSFVLPGALIR